MYLFDTSLMWEKMVISENIIQKDEWYYYFILRTDRKQ